MSEEQVNMEPTDRTGWEPGPWDNEEDRYEWRNGALVCLIVRNYSGALCGYVGVPPGHPWHGKSYSDLQHLECDEHDDECPYGCDHPYTGPKVHGGLTYSAPCQAGGSICHVPREGEPADVWWLGFDCAHSGDLVPGMIAIRKEVQAKIPGTRLFGAKQDQPGRLDAYGLLGQDTYRDRAYVQEQINQLAEQAKAAG